MSRTRLVWRIPFLLLQVLLLFVLSFVAVVLLLFIVIVLATIFLVAVVLLVFLTTIFLLATVVLLVVHTTILFLLFHFDFHRGWPFEFSSFVSPLDEGGDWLIPVELLHLDFLISG